MFGFGIRGKMAILKNNVRLAIKNRLLKPNLFDLKTSERIGVVYHQPSDMCETDRIMLYALVRGLRPKYAMEIGARWGGSARIITNAMQENGIGALVGIDPEPKAFRAKTDDLHHRYTLISGYSPEIIPEAMNSIDNHALDFVFIDALHTHDAVRADFLGVLPFLSPNAHILLHDTFHQGIDKAINDVVNENENLIDLGFITRNPYIGEIVSYQGLRLIRVGKVDSHEVIGESYERLNLKRPIFHYAFRNYDEFSNRIGKGASNEEIETIRNLLKQRDTEEKGDV